MKFASVVFQVAGIYGLILLILFAVSYQKTAADLERRSLPDTQTGGARCLLLL